MSSSKGRNSRPSKPAEAASGISLPAEIWPADKYCEQTCKKNLYDARDGYKDMKALQAWKSTIPNPYVFAKELQEGFADTWVNEHHWDLICQHGPDVHPHNKSQHLQKSCGDWVKKSKLGFCSYSHQRRVCRQGGAAFHISDPHNQSARQSGGKTNHKSLLQSPLKIPCGYALCQWSSRM